MGERRAPTPALGFDVRYRGGQRRRGETWKNDTASGSAASSAATTTPRPNYRPEPPATTSSRCARSGRRDRLKRRAATGRRRSGGAPSAGRDVGRCSACIRFEGPTCSATSSTGSSPNRHRRHFAAIARRCRRPPRLRLGPRCRPSATSSRSTTTSRRRRAAARRAAAELDGRRTRRPCRATRSPRPIARATCGSPTAACGARATDDRRACAPTSAPAIGDSRPRAGGPERRRRLPARLAPDLRPATRLRAERRRQRRRLGGDVEDQEPSTSRAHTVDRGLRDDATAHGRRRRRRRHPAVARAGRMAATSASEFGGIGHATHQNGLRRGRRLPASKRRPSGRRLSVGRDRLRRWRQDLVNRFVERWRGRRSTSARSTGLTGAEPAWSQRDRPCTTTTSTPRVPG